MIDNPPIGKTIMRCYEFDTIAPKKGIVESYEKAKKELEDIGLAWKYPY